MSVENPTSRRRFIRIAVATVAAAPVASVLLSRNAQAQDPVPLVETDPQGSALGYRADTTKVDAAKYPNHTAEQKCSNCNLIQGKDGDAQRPCAIFPGKLVAADGWCAAWVKKP